ncbi:hypothetical protein SLEP1_g38160 [Rubroshorea leprosula]|uniref:Leucine-rich repeat-containing N-terminal plant-type domain-containing protein n=1 Tax=Rubroshorea leprosula TaxID=152421 RepID=A0AAV5KWZ8_9ROSI|nr:hypothetical protein SLEP1_g38160 [Rubroshorea leprosula]
MELGMMAFGFLGALALNLDHPGKHACFLFFDFDYMKICLSNLKAVLCLVVTVSATRLQERSTCYPGAQGRGYVLSASSEFKDLMFSCEVKFQAVHISRRVPKLRQQNQMIRSAVGLNSTAGDHEVRGMERERQVLLAFKQVLVDDYGVLSSWGSEEEKRDCCKWRGVQCSKATGHVIELSLQDCSLRGGHLLSQLENLTSLQLNLRHNYFNSMENIEWLSHLSSLKYLDMSTINLRKVNNGLQVVNKLPYVTNLWLDFCNLLDVVPQSFPRVSNLTSLAVLDLSSRNVFQGPIPETFSLMTSLEYLYLKENQFVGIPKSFGNMCKLRLLHLSGYLGLGGMLHELIGNLSGCLQLSVEDLALDNGGIGEVLSDPITNFSLLRELSLGSNNLSGTVTKNIRLLSNLASFDLSFNSFDGVITEEYFSTQFEFGTLDLWCISTGCPYGQQWPLGHISGMRLPLRFVRDSMSSCSVALLHWKIKEASFSATPVSRTTVSVPSFFVINYVVILLHKKTIVGLTKQLEMLKLIAWRGKDEHYQGWVASWGSEGDQKRLLQIERVQCT